MDLHAWFRTERAAVDAALDAELPADPAADVVYQAMRYSLFAGGKRLRPLLAVLTGDALGQPRSLSMPYACALEMVHTYSLMHDDLPCMDNDDFRRGKPTCHKVYGEAQAMLAGDALLTMAFEVLARGYEALPAPRLARALGDFTRALGAAGMVVGQSRDLAAERRSDVTLAELQQIHAGKTGALIRVSLTGVARLAGDEAAAGPLAAYGEKLGLLFQVQDDILDVTGTAADLGKTPGKDAAQQKATYPRLLGLEGARRFLAQTADEAAALAEALPGEREHFRALVRWAAGRNS